jgi:hypothetical protein
MRNGFCIGDRSNEAFCQSCHVDYGWKDASFDFRASAGCSKWRKASSSEMYAGSCLANQAS